MKKRNCRTKRGLEGRYDALNYRDDQFDLSDAALSVALAMLAVTALTRKRWLLWFSMVFATLGAVMGGAGLLGRANAEIATAPAIAPHFELGRRGEALAIDHLERAGYRIVAANFSLPIGRNTRDAIVNAEIDVVAYDGPTLCFVEVKTRASDDFAPPQVNVDLRKRRQIARAARGYRRMFGLMKAGYRYDVVTVVLPPVDENEDVSAPRVELMKNFWTDEKLRKRNWHDSRWD